MMPIVLHSPSRKQTDAYVEAFIKKHGINRHFVTHIEPAGREFSIKQVRELVRDNIYARNELQLFVLYSFHTASIEAQNAFLKTLEEHKESDRFIMEAVQPYRLLPTILSRSQIVRIGGGDEAAPSMQADAATLLDAASSPPLNHPAFQVPSEDPSGPFDLLIAHYRTQLANNPSAGTILKEAITARSRALSNNITAQYALDRLLIFIYKISKS